MANIQNQDVLGGPSSAPGSATSMEKKNRRRNNAARRRLNNYWQQLQQTQQVQQTQEEHPEEQEQRTEIPSEDLIFHIPEPVGISPGHRDTATADVATTRFWQASCPSNKHSLEALLGCSVASIASQAKSSTGS